MARAPSEQHSPDFSEENLAFIRRRSAENWALMNQGLVRALREERSMRRCDMLASYDGYTKASFGRLITVGVDLGVIKRISDRAQFSQYSLTRVGMDILKEMETNGR